MDVSTITQLISTLGFPIIVAGYMIVKVQKTQEEILVALTKMIEVMNDLKDSMKGGDNNEGN